MGGASAANTCTCFGVLCVVFVLLSCLPTSLGSCREKSLEEREEMANVVVTGTVKKVMLEDKAVNGGMYRSEIEIKRIFKGDNVVKTLPNVMTDPVRHHKMVMVDGFGDPHICESEVHEADTKIFLLNRGYNGELKLNSSILPITLSNLDYTEAVVKDIPFKPVELPKSPCDFYFCAFGAVCMVNFINEPFCECQQQCSSVFAPVCGTDNVTYSSSCMLEKASCVHQKRIKVQQPGPCGTRNPCEGKVCRYGAKCQPSVDGKTARCQCPTHCYSYGDTVDGKPVCGSDGKDYPNWCELRKVACNKIEEIRVKYYGKCDPCEGHRCEAPEICQVDEQRNPVCKCKYACFNDMAPVCGTDGKTYSNKCVLDMEACKQRKDIKVLYQGECSAANNPCDQIRCGPMEECSVDRNGQASCVCPLFCEPVVRYVCGNNSRTYDSECELKKQSCLSKEYVVVLHHGQCGHDVPCRDYNCLNGAVCRIQNGQPSCICPQCSGELNPVCGENDITYENECKLRQENCETRGNIRIKQKGPCQSCGDTQCRFYEICEIIRGQPTCVCPTLCIKVDLPVCGSDGQTYSNECEMRLKSCQRKQIITKTSSGSCDKCLGVTCQPGEQCENGVCVCPILCPTKRAPVCGDNGRLYINDCELRKDACSRNTAIEIAREENCQDVMPEISGSGEGSGDLIADECDEEACGKYGGRCVVMADGAFTCTCDFNCEAIRSPVCGSDGRTYGNECQMRQAACTRRQEITSVSLDSCDFELDNDEPCDGAVPLVNALTGQDYNCNVGVDMCPEGSYCHVTPAFAKCCKEDVHTGRTCAETKYGCCKDGKMAALGPSNAGCPEYCHCNPIGSYGTNCDPLTRQCTCKPGVGGLRCDRCEIGYWGLHKIPEDNNAGCIACSCNRLGSERDDCDQMTGRCMCKPLVSGMKCDRCSNGQMVGPRGCGVLSSDFYQPTTCDELQCRFGSVCRRGENNHLECMCDISCDANEGGLDIVCGSDNQNYGSECEMKLFACRLSKELTVAHRGPCRAQPPASVTRTTTSLPSTSRSRKTTRHIDGESDPVDNNSDLSSGTRRPDVKDKDKDATDCRGSYIDGLCLNDADCCSNNSYCTVGLCHCLPGFVPSVDNRKCIGVVKEENQPLVTLAPDEDACADNPCYAGGQCELDEMLGFRCICPLGRSGPLCNKQAEFKVPSFSGRSFMELPKIKKASRDLSIEIVFQTLNKDGIILFNAQNPDGTGDFVSLAVRDGFVEFRFDLGAGEAVLRSANIVEPGRSHRVVARRVHSSGFLIVDSDPDVTGNSPSTHISLDLNDPLFLGYVPKVAKEVYGRMDVDLGLVGCVHSLRAGSGDEMYTYNLEFANINSDILNGADISECGSNPCKSMPCKNGGTCLVLDAEMFDCKCQSGYKGVLCEELVDACASQPCQHGGTCFKSNMPEGFECRCVDGREGTRCERESMPQLFVPQFTGSSYMAIPLDDSVGKMMTIEVWFRPLQPNGALLFATQFDGGLGDFISLNLVKKRLEFKYYLGSGIASLESKKTLHLDKWHKVVISRFGRDGQMTVNSEDPVTGQASGTLTQLDLGRSLYIGGFHTKNDVPEECAITTGFTGAIQRVIINGKTVDNLMAAAKDLGMANISEYTGPPCNVNPCMNGGVCIPILNSAECRCPYNFMGKHCEKRAEHLDKDQPVAFEGITYLNYPSEVKRNFMELGTEEEQPAQRSNEIKVQFKTKAENGMILFQGKADSVRGDYLSLAVVRGRVEFSYNLGKQTEENLHILRSRVDVTDGEWHRVTATRKLREGTLQVDKEIPITQSSMEGSDQLDTDGELWVGGRASLPWGLPQEYYEGFRGCVQEINVNGEDLHLVEHRNGHSSTIAFCS